MDTLIQNTYETIKRKRRSIGLEREDLERLDKICEHVIRKWEYARYPYPYTPHDYTHNIRVEEMLYKLFPPEELSNKLSAKEKFLIIASIWLHDIGMIPELFPEDKKPQSEKETIKWDKKVRDEHEKRTERYIRENRKSLELTDDEANAVIEICRFHRFKKYKELQNFAKENWEWDISGNTIRIPLLVACLRLSDALHIPYRATDREREFKIYLALGLDVYSKIHWLKSKYAWEVSPIQNRFKIDIVLKKPSRYPDEKMEPLKRTIEIELQDEIDVVRDILIKGGLPVYLNVECKCREYNLMGRKDKKELEELLTDIKLFDPTMSPNATAVVDAILRQINLFLDENEGDLLKDYKTNVLDILVKKRPCHVFLWKIKELLDNNIHDLKRIQDLIKVLQNKRKNAMEKLPEKAYPIFLMEDDPLLLLLYGYSSSVIRCLKYFVEKHPDKKGTLKVYVCQGVTKNKYRYNNRLVYCDGIKYITELKKIGIKDENINYITDSCASNLFSKREIKMVLFGANGINLKGYVGHTLGHLAIADMAGKYDVPVYVIADSLKIGNYFGNSNENLQRENAWLTTDIRFESEIENCTNYNPREDIVPPDRIKKIITEKGIINPKEIEKYVDVDIDNFK